MYAHLLKSPSHKHTHRPHRTTHTSSRTCEKLHIATYGSLPPSQVPLLLTFKLPPTHTPVTFKEQITNTQTHTDTHQHTTFEKMLLCEWGAAVFISWGCDQGWAEQTRRISWLYRQTHSHISDLPGIHVQKQNKVSQKKKVEYSSEEESRVQCLDVKKSVNSHVSRKLRSYHTNLFSWLHCGDKCYVIVSKTDTESEVAVDTLYSELCAIPIRTSVFYKLAEASCEG